MAESTNEGKSISPLDEKFTKSIVRFSKSLSDLREFSELVESLIKKHKLKELETALVRYDGLGDALCHFDEKLKSDITLIQQACAEDSKANDVAMKFEVSDDDKGGKVLRARGSREDLRVFDKSIHTPSIAL